MTKILLIESDENNALIDKIKNDINSATDAAYTSEDFKIILAKLADTGLRAAEAMESFSNAVYTLTAPLPASFHYNSSNFGDPWAPLHGIQAHFFRFDPSRWHTACARLIPTGHRVTYFYRKCWMFAKTFMNVKIEELEVEACQA